MPKYRIRWETTEADTRRPFVTERVVEAESEEGLALVPGQTAEAVPDDSPLRDWRTIE